MQPFPYPNYASDTSDKNLNAIGQMVAEIFMFESVNGQTDRRRLVGYTISSPCEPSAQVS